jgi:hypothetical protein
MKTKMKASQLTFAALLLLLAMLVTVEAVRFAATVASAETEAVE